MAAVLLVLSCLLALAPAAGAEQFFVDSTVDEADAAPDPACLTAAGKCTLRAAIEAANDSIGEFDEVRFEEEVFEGEEGDTISLATSLPAIADPVAIAGRQCATDAGVTGPCVGVDAPPSGVVLLVAADDVAIEGLAVTGGETGASVEGFDRLRVAGNWFGVGLDGSADGQATAVFVGPGADGAKVGGEGSESTNVFAHSSAVGLDVQGASGVAVLGNRFGVEPDGVTAAANGENVEITSWEGAEAVGNSIGTNVAAAAAASPGCDGGCNVVSGAAGDGIDLEGDGGAEGPALDTVIAANHVGLDVSGAVAVPNGGIAIRVGGAARTLVGGSRPGEANRIAGGSVAVSAGPGAAGLAVRGNLIGFDAAGTQPLAPPDDGILVDSEGLASAGAEATVSRNRIRMEGGVGIANEGFGATISANAISGAATGIWVHGATAGFGNRIEDNVVEAAQGSGVLVETDSNEVLGNEISGAAGVGILVRETPPWGVTGNVIGGDTAAAENLISGSGADAIEIVNPELTWNEVARNRGAGNAGLFIDLVASSGTEAGPGEGIEPPTFALAIPTGASGVAEPGARVRVFRKQSAEAGELQSFLAEVVADEAGEWSVLYGEALSAGTIVAATQTDESGATSELATATTAGAGGGGTDGGGSGGAGAAADTTPPQTRIFRGPKARSRSATARFRFGSNEFQATFACKLDRRRFRPCDSPHAYKGLDPGRQVFRVRATDAAGNVDPSPAKRRFAVLG